MKRTESTSASLKKIEAFAGLDEEVKADLATWGEVFESLDPAELLTTRTEERFSTFQRLCLLRAIRPDVVVPAIQGFISEQMGEKFIDPPPFDLMSCYEDSSCTTPLV